MRTGETGTRNRGRKRWRIAVVAGALWVLLAAPCLAGSPPGRCLSVEVPWPVEMPDGAVHEAGTLRICSQGDFTPVIALQDIEVAGRQTGRWTARREWSEAVRAHGPVAIFLRSPRGAMALVGFACPEHGGGSTTYRLDRGTANPASRAGEFVLVARIR